MSYVAVTEAFQFVPTHEYVIRYHVGSVIRTKYVYGSEVHNGHYGKYKVRDCINLDLLYQGLQPTGIN